MKSNTTCIWNGGKEEENICSPIHNTSYKYSFISLITVAEDIQIYITRIKVCQFWELTVMIV